MTTKVKKPATKTRSAVKINSGLDGCLVVFRHGMDDIPLMLTSDRTEAMAFAKAVKAKDGQREMGVIGIDATTPNNVAIYYFNFGKLVRVEMVKTFG